MWFRLGIRRMFRDKYRSLCLLFIFSLATTIWGVSICIYQATLKNLNTIEENIQTVAIRQEITQRVHLFDDAYTLGKKRFDETAIEAAIQSSNSVVSYNTGSAFSALSGSLMPLTSGTVDPMGYEWIFDVPWNAAAFTITCLSVTPETGINSFSFSKDDPSVSIPEYGISYTAVAEVVKAHAISPYYKIPKRIDIFGILLNARGEVPLKAGETYFVFGTYRDVPITVSQVGRDAGGINIQYQQDPEAVPKLDLTLTDYQSSSITKTREDGSIETNFYQDESMPIVSSPNNAAYIEKVTQMIQRNNRLLPVYGVDNLNAMILFHEKEAYIVNGREFSPEESQKGADVCLINEAFAKANNLSVGQVIPLAVYENRYVNINGSRAVYAMNNITKEKLPVTNKSFLIIGIYRMPMWQKGAHFFSPNTIFVPHNSIAGKGLTAIPAMESLTLQNGSADSFRKAIADIGIEDQLYLIYDGGYQDIKDSMLQMVRDTRLLTAVCAFAWVCITLCALILYIFRYSEEISVLRILGTKRIRVWVYVLSGAAALLFAASALAGLLLYGFNQPVTSLVENMYVLKQRAFSSLASDDTLMRLSVDRNAITFSGVFTFLLSMMMAIMITAWQLAGRKLLGRFRKAE